MSSIAQYDNTDFDIVQFSSDFSAHVSSSVIAAGRLDKAYHDTKAAISKVGNAFKADNIFKQKLMQNTLHRDMNILLDGIMRMEKSLADSIKLMICSGDEALVFNSRKKHRSNEVSEDQKNAIKNTTENLEVLRWLELLITSSDRHRH